MFCLPVKTFYYWYKNFLSDYISDKQTGRWCSEKTESVSKKTGEITQKPVYVFKPENLGVNMSIDDKAIGEDGFTVLSNNDTGKMAMPVESTRAEEVEQAMEKFGSSLQQIKNISMDMSSTYALVFNDLIPQAVQVVDKFHVMKYVCEAVGDVRRRTVKELTHQLSKEKKRTAEDEQILKDIELLRRISHAITQSPDKWNMEMQETVQQIFMKYRDIQTAYWISQDFKLWYAYQNGTKPIETTKNNLQQWYAKAAQIGEFKSVIKMIKKHEPEILNYFRHGLTNAKAENLNGKLQRFVSANYGLKDKDFFLYRTVGYFS
ncbi:MAG: transposase [Bacteroidales bacterium]|jgi:transposase|nr:transposase [Bacteroidales bacterium]